MQSRKDQATSESSTTSKLKSGSSALITGALELVLFHPLGTVATRLQNHRGTIFVFQSLTASFSRFYNIVTIGGSLYSGIGAGAVDKVVKRGYKLAGQRILRENILEHYLGSQVENAIGKRHKNPVLDGLAGSMIGVGEVIFLPIDYIKTNKQNKNDVFRNRDMFTLLRSTEGYAGWRTVATRNFFGSAFLFGISSATYEYLFKIQNRKEANHMQNFTASAFGSTVSVVGTMPWDVVKTRMQISSSNVSAKKETGSTVAKNMLLNEGVSSFFKGGGTKATASVMKLTFGLTVFTEMTIWMDKHLSKRNVTAIESVQGNDTQDNTNQPISKRK